MSVHRSLKASSGIVKHKNVLTKKERISKLRSTDNWTDASTIYGMPKVGNRKLVARKKAKKKED